MRNGVENFDLVFVLILDGVVYLLLDGVVYLIADSHYARMSKLVTALCRGEQRLLKFTVVCKQDYCNLNICY